MTRREFLLRTLCSVPALTAGAEVASLLHPSTARASDALHPARFCMSVPGGKVHCLLCPRGCEVAPGERGFCGARENRSGKYTTLVYGQVASQAVDPIEKLPMYHFYPGMRTFAIATACCNLNCKYCQSWQFAQARPEDVESQPMSPSQVVHRAKDLQCPAVAFTYSEPVNFIEYATDVAQAARRAGLLSVCHTAGYVRPEALKVLIANVDAFNVDLKGFTETFYQQVCEGHLAPVLESIKTIHKAGNPLELTYLVIPTLNDDTSKVREMCEWITENLGQETPVHFTRFFPMYKLRNLAATPRERIESLRKMAFDSGLQYVYVGNMVGHGGESTYCPKCERLLVHRVGYTVRSVAIKRGRCAYCNHRIPGHWA